MLDVGDGWSRRRVLRDVGLGAGLLWTAPAVRSVRLVAAGGTPEPGTTTTAVTVPEPEAGVHLHVACTNEEPFQLTIVLVGFAPDTEFRYRIHVDYADGTDFDEAFWFHTDALGGESFPSAIPSATQPYEIQNLDLFIDPDHDDHADFHEGPGIAGFNGYFNVTEPCTSPRP